MAKPVTRQAEKSEDVKPETTKDAVPTKTEPKMENDATIQTHTNEPDAKKKRIELKPVKERIKPRDPVQIL